MRSFNLFFIIAVNFSSFLVELAVASSPSFPALQRPQALAGRGGLQKTKNINNEESSSKQPSIASDAGNYLDGESNVVKSRYLRSKTTPTKKKTHSKNKNGHKAEDATKTFPSSSSFSSAQTGNANNEHETSLQDEVHDEEPKQCLSWCGTDARPWRSSTGSGGVAKCNWRNCGACQDCIQEPIQSSTTTSRTPKWECPENKDYIQTFFEEESDAPIWDCSCCPPYY